MAEHAAKTIKLMDLVNRLPLSDEQKLAFVKNHIEEIKKDIALKILARNNFNTVMAELVE